MADLTNALWRKPSYSNGGQQNSCVEVARHCPGHVAVRDSKDPHGPVLFLQPRAWRSLTADVKAGRYDLA